MIVALLPVLVVPSLFFGFELPLYLFFGLVGMILWIYIDDPIANFIGSQLARIGFALFIVAFIYYFFSGNLFTTKPFEFRFLKMMIGILLEFYGKIANFIGGIFV